VSVPTGVVAATTKLVEALSQMVVVATGFEVMVGAALNVSVAAVEVTEGVQAPDTTQRKRFPFCDNTADAIE
jgi:hypothetical protein